VFFDSLKTGEVTARLNDASRIQRTISYIFGTFIIDVLTIIVVAIFSTEIKNASFRYVGRPLILKNINFLAKKGEALAIVGDIGCGKSTSLLWTIIENEKKNRICIIVTHDDLLAQKADYSVRF